RVEADAGGLEGELHLAVQLVEQDELPVVGEPREAWPLVADPPHGRLVAVTLTVSRIALVIGGAVLRLAPMPRSPHPLEHDRAPRASARGPYSGGLPGAEAVPCPVGAAPGPALDGSGGPGPRRSGR